MPDVRRLPWRVGRKLYRTVYAQVGDEPSDDDVFIGIFDEPEIAEIAVVQHNTCLDLGVL